MESIQLPYLDIYFLPDTAFTTLYFIEERNNPNSIWKPYLESFDQDYYSFPCYFNNQEKNLCKGTWILKKYEKEMKDQRIIYDFFYKNVEEFQNISFTEFFKIYVGISIRVFSFYNKEGMNEKACSQFYLRFFRSCQLYIAALFINTKRFFSQK